MNKPIETKEDLIRSISEKDAILKEHNFNYIQRAHLHIVAKLQLMDKHPELQQFIAEAYDEFISSEAILQQLRNDRYN